MQDYKYFSRSVSLSIDPEVQNLFKAAYESEGIDRNRAAEEAFRMYAEKHNPGAIIDNLKAKIADYEAKITVLSSEASKLDAIKNTDAYKFLVSTFKSQGYYQEESNKIIQRRWIGFLCDRMSDDYRISKDDGIGLIKTVVSQEIVSEAQREKFWDVLKEISL